MSQCLTNKYKALFLDLDGTILDTLEDLKDAVNFALVTKGFKPRTNQQIINSIGHGSYHLIKTSLPENIDEKTYLETFNTYKNYYKNHADIKTSVYPGVLDLLTKFKQNGGKIALITNKPHEIATNLIHTYFGDLFDAIYGHSDIYPAKPNPYTIQLALNDLSLSKEDVLFIGDSYVDYDTANNASLDCLICSYGFESKESLISKSVSPIIDSFYEVEAYL